MHWQQSYKNLNYIPNTKTKNLDKLWLVFHNLSKSDTEPNLKTINWTQLDLEKPIILYFKSDSAWLLFSRTKKKLWIWIFFLLKIAG